ncbi:MAG: 23S rRNA (uracil(1939)-C(5))-methyltransferase RlmD [Alistipes sp.]
MRKKANYPLIEGLEITALAAEGKAMGRWNNQVVFVPMTVPGDVVDVQIRVKRRRFMEGFVVKFIKQSSLREEPFCAHFGVCGGCKWQNLPYAEQLRFKSEQVHDQLSRIGKLELPEIRPCLASVATQFYRNKLEYTFADRRWMTYEEIGEGTAIEPRPALGFHIPAMFDKVLDIDKCWLQGDPSNAIRLETKHFCEEHGYEFYNARTHSGLMRNMIIRTASTGEVMVIMVFHADERERIVALLDHLSETFPEITSLFYVVNEKWNDSLGDQTPVCYKGKDHIIEQMEGLQFKVGPKSFYQTNSVQAYELYKVARDFAGLTGSEVLYDLYTGTGTIANFCAARCAKVVGIEYVPEAIEDAKVNAALNGITNTVFYAGDMKNVLSDDFVAANGHPDVIILDPPRAGIDEPVIEVILRAAPERIVYVSCNPATQARDLALMDAAYRVEAVQPVDMFPHTHHVENVVKLVKRSCEQ